MQDHQLRNSANLNSGDCGREKTAGGRAVRLGRHADRFLSRGFPGVSGDVPGDGAGMGTEGTRAALFAGLVHGVPGGGDPEGTLGSGGQPVARELCEASLEAGDRSAASFANVGTAARVGIGDQRGSRASVPAIEGIRFDANVWRTSLRRRHSGEEAAPGTAADGAGAGAVEG